MKRWDPWRYPGGLPGGSPNGRGMTSDSFESSSPSSCCWRSCCSGSRPNRSVRPSTTSRAIAITRVLDAPFLVCVGPGPSGGHLRRPPSRTTSSTWSSEQVDVLTFGLSLAAIGAAQAVAFAWFRYGGCGYRRRRPTRGPRSTRSSPRSSTRPPSGRSPGHTARRGLPDGSSILIQAIVYTWPPAWARRAGIATCSCSRSGSGGLRLATVRTGGIGAPSWLHPDFVRLVRVHRPRRPGARGAEPDEVEALHVPEGWREARRPERRPAQQRRLALHRGRLGRATLCGEHATAAVALYVHLPFCVARCPTVTSSCTPAAKREDLEPGRSGCMRQSAASWRCAPMPRRAVRPADGRGRPDEGGRPDAAARAGPWTRVLRRRHTVLVPAEWLERLMATVRRRYGLAPDAEVTLEANPARTSAATWPPSPPRE